MKSSYTVNTNKVFGFLNASDLREWLYNFKCESITLKNKSKSVRVLQTQKWTVRNGRTRNVKTYLIDGVPTEKFSDVYKACIPFFKLFSMAIFENEVVITNNDVLKRQSDCVFTYDTEEWVLESDAYHCVTNDEWYEDNGDLVWVSDDDEYHLDDDDDICWCERCEKYHLGSTTEVHVNSHRTEWWCESCVDNHAFTCDDCGEVWDYDYSHSIDRPCCTVCDYCYEENYYYCEECCSNVHSDYYDYDNNCCCECSGTRCANEVKSYHWHHNHDYTNRYSLFMPKGKTVRLGESHDTKTIGIELEVSKDTYEGQQDTIDQLVELVEENEIFFEHDGSLDCGGFEIITGVHTFEGLMKMPWEKILEVLRNNGYRSHDGGLCGLHVHIGRKFFGENETAQNEAIGRIYGFYAMYWQDLVKASRRERMTYCGHPYDEVDRDDLITMGKENPNELKRRLTHKAERKEGSHGLALNNANYGTFEFRLGRGTLKYESFKAWIDLTIAIAKNSKRVSTRKVENCDYWLKGISKATAMYLKERGAFNGSEVIKSLTETAVAQIA